MARKKITDEEIAEALRTANGNQSGAARLLGRHPAFVCRALKAGTPWPDGILRGVSTRPYKPAPWHRKYSDSAIAEALAAGEGNISTAARLIGASHRTVAGRLDRNGALMPDGVTRRGRGRPRGSVNNTATARREARSSTRKAEYGKRHAIPRERIVDALRLARGNMTRAALTLGCSSVAVGNRVRNDPTLMPEGVQRLGRGRPAAASVNARKAVA